MTWSDGLLSLLFWLGPVFSLQIVFFSLVFFFVRNNHMHGSAISRLKNVFLWFHITTSSKAASQNGGCWYSETCIKRASLGHLLVSALYKVVALRRFWYIGAITHYNSLARIPVFRGGGSMEWGRRRRRPSRGCPGASSPGKFLNFKSAETWFPPFWGKVSVFYYVIF